MAEEGLRPIIVKRIKKSGGGHGSGAWKIAYADFVTAMMAFFLLMWLLGATTKGDLNGISEYFNTPLSVALSGGTRSGAATSVLEGGAMALQNSSPAEVNKGPKASRAMQLPLSPTSRTRQLDDDAKRLTELKAKIEGLIEQNP